MIWRFFSCIRRGNRKICNSFQNLVRRCIGNIHYCTKKSRQEKITAEILDFVGGLQR